MEKQNDLAVVKAQRDRLKEGAQAIPQMGPEAHGSVHCRTGYCAARGMGSDQQSIHYLSDVHAFVPHRRKPPDGRLYALFPLTLPVRPERSERRDCDNRRRESWAGSCPRSSSAQKASTYHRVTTGLPRYSSLSRPISNQKVLQAFRSTPAGCSTSTGPT